MIQGSRQLLCTAALLVLSMFAGKSGAEPFRDGDTVVFFGDSITHGGMYYKFVPGYVEYWPRYREVRAELLAEQEKVYALARLKLRHYRIVRKPR